MTKPLTPAKKVKAFWNKHAYYTRDHPQDGGRARWLAVELEGHLIIGTSLKDFAGKLYSHELGVHRYCLPIEVQPATSL